MRRVIAQSKWLLAIAALITMTSLSACLNRDNPDVGDFDPDAQLETDIDLIEEYLRENGLTANVTESGLHYIITSPGTGAQAVEGDEVVVDYAGYTLNDRVFDTSKSLIAQGAGIWQPERDYVPIEFTLGLGQVIEGWEEGIQLLNEGASATFFIPSRLAYGQFGTQTGQFRNTVLAFDVDLLDIK